MILDSITEVVRGYLEGAVSTNQPEWTASWADHNAAGEAFTPGGDHGVLNDTTPVQLVGSPAASIQRQLKQLTIFNADTAAVVAVIDKYDGSDSRRWVRATLQPNWSLQWEPGGTWHVYDADGILQTGATGGGGASATVTSQTLSVLSNKVSVLSNAVSIISQGLSALSQQNSVEHAELSDRITSVAGLAVQSVTSDELSQAVSVVSQAISAGDALQSARSQSIVTSASMGNIQLASLLDLSVIAEPPLPGTSIVRLHAKMSAGLEVLDVNFPQGDAQVLRDRMLIVENAGAVNMVKGRAVYIGATVGGVIKAQLARADSSATMPAIGLVWEDIISVSASGRVMLAGLLSAVSTAAWGADGEILYVDTTSAGQLTSVKPDFPNLAQQIAVIVNSGGAGIGQLLVNPEQFTGINVLSNAVSVAAAALSARIDTQSQGVSVVSVAAAAADAHADAASAAATSIGARLNSVLSTTLSAFSQTLSVHSQQLSLHSQLLSFLQSSLSARSAGDVSTRGMQSIINALSNRISTAGGGGGSVTSNEVSAVSAQAASAINVVSARLASILSTQLSTLSVNVVSLQSTVSHLRSAVSNVSAVSGAGSATGLQAVIDALSNRISGVGGGGASVTSAEYVSTLSDVSHLRSIVSNVSAQSAGGSATGLQAVINLLSNKISGAGGGGGSVTSAEVVNIAPWQAAVYRAVSNTQSTAGSALTDVSGMVLTVAAGERWHIDGMALLSTSAATAGLRMGWSVPPLSTPRFALWRRVCAQQSAVGSHGAGQLQVSGASVTLSLTSITPAGAVYAVEFRAIMDVASAGTARLMFAGVASTAASPHHILNGTYMLAYRLK